MTKNLLNFEQIEWRAGGIKWLMQNLSNESKVTPSKLCILNIIAFVLGLIYGFRNRFSDSMKTNVIGVSFSALYMAE